MTDELLDIDDQDSDYDGAWKEAIREYFRVFIQVFFPLVFSEIDWAVEPVWLDKEISQIIGQRKQRNRVVDVLVQVRLLNGQDQWILLHVEIQSRFDAEHAERLSYYHAGIMGSFRKPVVTLSILADLNQDWLPREHELRLGDFRVKWEFAVCKLLHHLESDWAQDKRLPVVMARAQIAALRTASDPQGRFDAKLQLIRNLIDEGYTANELRPLFRLIDWMMRLRKDLDELFDTQMKEIEKERSMPFVTTWERRGQRIGREEGLREGRLQLAISLMPEACGPIPEPIRHRLEQQEPTVLTQFVRAAAVGFQSWDEVDRWLDEHEPVATSQ